MKQLTCEMCGSTDLMKDGGVFVCQTCGCKYSVEEAKKMMVEGTVEVQGVVQVANTAQISNLMNMANSAFESKNFSKAEDFCNQILAMDDKNYEAWMLKGRAINYQINTNNPRILEVYNCIMEAYRTLEGSEVDKEPIDPVFYRQVSSVLPVVALNEKLEVIGALKECMEGEVDFWVKRFELDRPTDEALHKVKATYVDCYNKMKAAYEEMGLEHEEYLKNFDNHFCSICNKTCVSAWKTTVAYNYFRDDLNNLGAHWNRTFGRREYTDDFRPNEDIRETFMKESGNLINLLEFCIEQFNDLTSTMQKKYIYGNISYYYEVRKDQVSYQAMVSTTTNGYGAVTNRSEYYEVNRRLTAAAVQINKENSERYAALEKEMVELAEQEKERKIAEYWAEHAEEKTSLENERAALQTKVSELNASIDNLPETSTVELLESNISDLKKERDSLGLFKGKEKKALQERIDHLNQKLSAAIDSKNSAIAPIQSEIKSLEDRIAEIDEEFTKER